MALTSLTRVTSDHIPLQISITTKIPKPNSFRFENAWLFHHSFLPCVTRAWSDAIQVGDAAKTMAACLKATRAAAKAWSRSVRAPPTLHQNCKFIIRLLDLYEEHRSLSIGEAALRRIARDRLSMLVRERAAYWRQRGKIRWVTEGDANTKFFHAHASQKLRTNQIKAVQFQGSKVTDQSAKLEIFTQYYTQLLGTADTPQWQYDLESLYDSTALVDQQHLDAPFTMAEAKKALQSINKTSAPGPDGFGSAFYCAAWDHVAPQIEQLLVEFHSGDADLARINRAHIILLPKKMGIISPEAYRPISLQNITVKLLTKIMTTRLQREITKIVSMDQTGFIKGRSITENFVLATELVQCCYRRKIPSFALKLDFAKAFDSVNWESLINILEVRGFSQRWCTWIKRLLQSSLSAVVLNGIPGKWITCKKGLRQGDLISPCLFLIVADVLPALVKRDGGVRHPIASDFPCPILQYADDTLILLPADRAQVQRLCGLLDSFSASTGLKINYSKSTLVPIHVPDQLCSEVQGILQCKYGTIPPDLSWIAYIRH